MEDQSGAEKGFLYQQHEVNVGAMTCGITCGGRREAVEQEHGTTDNHLDCQNDNSTTYLVDIFPVDSERIN